MKIFMIGVIAASKSQILGYRLLDFEDGQVKDVPAKALIDTMKNGFKVENIEIQGNKIVGTNGTIDRYPLIINGIPYKKSPLIVLKEMNNGDYMVCDFKGEIVRMRQEDVIKYAEVEGISNGKVVERDGTKFISAINGEYDKEPKIDIEKTVQRIESKFNLLGVTDYKFNQNKEFVIKNKLLTHVKVPDGVTRIADFAFGGMKDLEAVVLPASIEHIGVGAFMGCDKLTSIVIQNGVKVIPKSCFNGCISLEEIIIPQSVIRVESRAFDKCRKLKKIKLKNPNTYIEFGALPPGCRKEVIKRV